MATFKGAAAVGVGTAVETTGPSLFERTVCGEESEAWATDVGCAGSAVAISVCGGRNPADPARAGAKLLAEDRVVIGAEGTAPSAPTAPVATGTIDAVTVLAWIGAWVGACACSALGQTAAGVVVPVAAPSPGAATVSGSVTVSLAARIAVASATTAATGMVDVTVSSGVSAASGTTGGWTASARSPSGASAAGVIEVKIDGGDKLVGALAEVAMVADGAAAAAAPCAMVGAVAGCRVSIMGVVDCEVATEGAAAGVAPTGAGIRPAKLSLPTATGAPIPTTVVAGVPEASLGAIRPDGPDISGNGAIDGIVRAGS